MKETLILEELIGCAGIPANGSCTVSIPVLWPSTKPRLLALEWFCADDGHALLAPSRRLFEGDC